MQIATLGQKADEVQRDMTRYADPDRECAGLDHWDEMPVVVEGWLRVFKELQAALVQRDISIKLLTEARDRYACEVSAFVQRVREDATRLERTDHISGAAATHAAFNTGAQRAAHDRAAWKRTCPHGDVTCPCQDGDACNHDDTARP